MEQKITQLTTLFLFLIGMFQMQGQLYSGVQVSDVGSSNSIGFSNTSKSVVIGNDSNNLYAAALASSTLSGTATICEGESANLQVAIVGGLAPYTVVYSDGSSQFTVDNYQSNQTISVNPSVTTNYSLVSVTDSNDESTGLQGTPTVTVINYVTYYLDSDGDGYGNPDETAQLCTGVPLGYVVLGTDCDDTNPTIHPGAVDVCYDGIDNDCNGVIDNVEQPGGCIPIVSQLVPSLCGVTVSRINATISCSFPNGAQGFRFKVTKVDLVTEIPIGDPIYIDRPVANFSLSSVTAVSYNSKYQIEVSVKYNNVFQPFNGIPCYITTPNPVATIGSQCGSTLASMNQWITSSIVPQIGSYKFRVTQLNSSGMPVGTSQEFVSTMARFNMTQFVGVLYNTNYSVEVSLRNIDMVYLPYNAPCTITTPAHPTTQIRESQCTNYVVASKTENIYADLVTAAVEYRFRMYLLDASNAVVYDYTYNSLFNRVTISNFPGLLSGVTYFIQVAVKMSNQPAFGPYGATCTIQTPGASRTLNSETALEVANVFEAIAFPNPFAENFKLEVKTNNEADLEIRVYDMIGKLVEQKTVTATDIQTIEVGSNYPSGVYNVIVSQEQTTKTLRVIKR
jgi:hypothetical protein